MEPTLTIGMLSKQTGCKVTTIRFYEQKGLLAEPSRTEGNQRRYSKTQVDRLRFILHARELGFDLKDTGELLTLSEPSENNACSHRHEPPHTIAEQHLVEVKHRIKRLNALKRELEAMLEHCGKTASAKSSAKPERCRVIEVLCDHRLCHEEHR